MKKIFKIFIFILIFVYIIWNAFAFDAQMQVDKTNVWLWETFNLRFEVKTATWGNISIKDIKNINNFNIVWKSQSSSSATQIVVENWKTKSKSITTYDLDLVLQAKNKWKFELWPAIINQNWKDIKTNSVSVNVTDVPIINNTSNNNVVNSWVNNSLRKKTIEKYDYNIIYFLLIIIWIVWTLFYLNKKWLLFDNSIKKIEDNNIDTENNNIKDEKKITDNEDEIKEVNIEEIEKTFSYPEINDIDFNNKIDEIFRKKLESKFWIWNIYWLTYEEILKKTWNKQEIKDVVDLLVKIKYSNVILDKNKLLELIKDI